MEDPRELRELTLTYEEAWAVRDFMREHQAYGKAWDKDDMRAVHKAILALQKAEVGSTQTLAIDLGTIWMIEQQVPSGYMVGTQPVGRNLLLKVMEALRAEPTTEGEEIEADLPAALPLPPYIEALNAERERAELDFRAWEQKKEGEL